MTGRSIRVVIGDAAYDPSALFARFASRVDQVAARTWSLELPHALNGLAMIRATTPLELTSIECPLHPGDSDGWLDYTEAGAGQWEFSLGRLERFAGPHIGRVDASFTDSTIYRWGHAWYWDTTAPPADGRLLHDLGLETVSDQQASAAGKGAWTWRVVKLGWRAHGVYKAYTIAHKVWKELDPYALEHREVMSQRQHHLHAQMMLAQLRRQQLESGSASSRKKAREKYSALDALMAMNS